MPRRTTSRTQGPHVRLVPLGAGSGDARVEPCGCGETRQTHRSQKPAATGHGGSSPSIRTSGFPSGKPELGRTAEPARRCAAALTRLRSSADESTGLRTREQRFESSRRLHPNPGNGAFRVSGAGGKRSQNGPFGNRLATTGSGGPRGRLAHTPPGMSILPGQTRTTPCSRSRSLQLASVGSRSVAIIASTLRPSSARSCRYRTTCPRAIRNWRTFASGTHPAVDIPRLGRHTPPGWGMHQSVHGIQLASGRGEGQHGNGR